MRKMFMKRALALALSATLIISGAEFSKPVLAATEDDVVEINEETFPDEIFRAYVKENIDANGDEKLSASEIEDCKNIDVQGKKIENLEGIEYFTELTELWCTDNSITSLDVSNNVKLDILECSDNMLTRVDVSKNIILGVLGCANNNLKSLDVSDNKELYLLYCKNDNLTSLDVSNNSELIELDCRNNNLTSLDVGINTELRLFYCDGNNLTSIDVSNNAELGEFSCGDNNIASLDVSKNTKLENLLCKENNLTSLDISNNTELGLLYCINNNLKSLDLSNNTKLYSLCCSGNSLGTIDVSNNTELYGLQCVNNNLISLDLSNNPKLTELQCSNNDLTSLDVSMNAKLAYLDCRSNKITCLDLTKNPSLNSNNVYVDDDVIVKYSGYTEDSKSTEDLKNDETLKASPMVTVATPTLSYVANTQTGIKVTWKKATNATGYIVYRKASGGNWTKIATISDASTLSYDDTAVAKKSGSTYSYTVQAYNKDAKGTVTNSTYDTTGKSVIRLTQVTLATPVNTAKGVTVKWSKVTGATGYIVYRKTVSAKSWTKVATVKGNTKVSYLDKKAKTNGTKYTYTVKAYYGSSVGTANQTGKTIYYVKGTSLTSAKNTASKKATVKWKKNAKATGYQIQYSTSSKFKSAKSVTVKGSSSVSKTLSKLAKGKTYYVRIRAYKKAGSKTYYSAWSALKKVKVSK